MSDLHIEAVGGGAYDLVLPASSQPRDFVLVGQTAASFQLEVQQRIVYAVGTWLGESAFDRARGFPWEQGVFGRQPAEGIVVFLYDTIVGVDGVQDLIDAPTIELESRTRKASIQVDARGEDFVASVTQIVQDPT